MSAQVTEESAIVSYIEGGYAFLETGGAESTCSKCSSRSSCGSVSLVKKSASHLRIENTLGLKAGDSVVLGLATNKLLLGTAMMYLLPLFALFTFAAIGKYYGGELYSGIAGLTGLFAGLFLVRKFVMDKRVIKQFTPKAIHKVTFKPL